MGAYGLSESVRIVLLHGGKSWTAAGIGHNLLGLHYNHGRSALPEPNKRLKCKVKRGAETTHRQAEYLGQRVLLAAAAVQTERVRGVQRRVQL